MCEFHSSTSVVRYTNKLFFWTDSFIESLNNTHTLVFDVWHFCLIDTCFSQQIFLILIKTAADDVMCVLFAGLDALWHLSGGQMMSWRPFDLRTQLFLTLTHAFTPTVRSISMCYEQPSVTNTLHIKLG